MQKRLIIMKLKSIEIVNFRSISNVTISPEPSCQGFVGINESGKSNILKAISTLAEERELSKDDTRIEGSDEERDQKAFIEYLFELSASEMQIIVDGLLEKIYCEKTLPEISFSNGKKITIPDFFLRKNTGIYKCNIITGKKYAQYYSLNKNEMIVLPRLKKKLPTSNINSIVSNSGNAVSLENYDFIEADAINPDNDSLFQKCNTEDLNKLFGKIICKYVEENLPLVIYWKYDSKYLLPNSIAFEEFKNNPDSCLPLKSMFNLAGYDDINDLLTKTLEQRSNRLTNILNNVSKKSSEYLHKVWRDYKNVSFELRKNGANIDIHIHDAENFYACEQRSDGFKRFITFLLALSARVNNGEISNAIIVVDEPDLGIHILGQKNLVQELIKISKNNLVFYSTHSIFMIDRLEPSRHFIVSKKKEITTIDQVAESNYTDDEVIFNALGYSIFEALRPKNILFEGWSDKKVYDLAIKTAKGKRIGAFDNVGRVHSTGVKNIVNIAKNLELANREYFVISDSDEPAKNKRKEYAEKEQCIGKWYLYEEFKPGIHTLEDFISHSAFKKNYWRCLPQIH